MINNSKTYTTYKLPKSFAGVLHTPKVCNTPSEILVVHFNVAQACNAYSHADNATSAPTEVSTRCLSDSDPMS